MNTYILYVKTTNKCQLKCQHCYASKFCNSSDRIDLDAVKKFIKNKFEQEPDCEIIASLHGGEPLYFSDSESMKELISFVRETKTYGKIYWSITTNLVYELTEDIIELFREFNQKDEERPLVITSYDYKIRFSNEKQEELWEYNVKRLKELNFKVQVIISLSKYIINDIDSIPNIFLKFHTELNVDTINFERITDNGRAVDNKLRPSNSEVNKWLYEAYKVYKFYKKELNIPLFDSLENAVKNGVFTGCRARECMRKVITINPDGSVATCPNISDITYTDIYNKHFDNDKFVSLCNLEEKVNPTCFICEYYNYCNGDCCQLKWDDTGCPGLKDIIKEMLIEK